MPNARSNVAHLCRRAGFGATPAQLDAATAAGYPATVDALLAGLASAPDPTGDALPPPTFAPYQGHHQAPGSPAALASAKAVSRVHRSELRALQDWWLNRMIVTSTPLREKLTLLWHGHFATAVGKVRDPHLMFLQNQLFRTAGAGSFEVLTQAVAKDGAMMAWLDTGKDQKAHPNENFARECMELFTLGIGHYTQGDVEEVARCFTGWAYDRRADRWVLRPGQHDGGTKTILGATGDFGGEEAVSILVRRPESARFVVARIWSHLAYPVATTDPVVTDLLGSYTPGLDVATLLRAVFLHPAFLSPTARTGLVKQPVELVVGAARALGLDAGGRRLDPTTGLPVAASAAEPSTYRLAVLATVLAQTLFDPPNVSGWGQNGYWLDTATSLTRLRIGRYLAGRADLSTIERTGRSGRLGAVARLLGLADGFGPTSSSALSRVTDDPRSLVALAINSPEYVLD